MVGGLVHAIFLRTFWNSAVLISFKAPELTRCFCFCAENKLADITDSQIHVKIRYNCIVPLVKCL